MSAPQDTDPASRHAAADRYEMMFREESQLINHRISWMMASHAFFVAAYVQAFSRDYFPIALTVAIVGLIQAFLTLLAVNAAVRAQRECWLPLLKRFAIPPDEFPLAARSTDRQRTKSTDGTATFVIYSLPSTTILMWIVLLVVRVLDLLKS